MEGPSGHLTREAAQLWTHQHSHLHSAPSTASPSVEIASLRETRYGFSSSYDEPSHQHYHQHQLQQQQQQQQVTQSAQGGRGGGVQLRHHLQQHQERQDMPMMHHQNSQSSSLGSNGGEADSNPARLSMSVHDLKQMTAMRMGGHHDGDGSGSGGDGRTGGNSNGGGGATPLLSSSSLRSPTGSDQLSNGSLHRLVGLVDRGGSPDLNGGGGGITRPSSASHHQHMLRTAREQQQQQQHDLPPGQQQPPLLLSRHASLGSPSTMFSRQQHQHQHQHQSQSGAGRGQQLHQLAQQQPTRLHEAGGGGGMMSGGPQQQQQIERGIRRGVSAPRMYANADEQHLGGGGGGGGGGGQQRPVFGPGLSVEKLKELTKLRLRQEGQQGQQHQQQGQGRSSPSFKGRMLPMNALASSLGNSGGVGFGHRNERIEYRRSGSAGSAAMMMEEHHRAMVEDGSVTSGSYRRRANSLMGPRGGVMHGEVGSAPMHGGGRVFNGNGRMEGPPGLEDRMRSLQSETARGGGGGGGGAGGGVSPRILSQPSSPCFSATSHTSSACTSPGRGGRAGNTRHGSGSHFHSGSGGGLQGFHSDGGVRVDSGGALHTTLSLRLSGDGRSSRGAGSDDGFWGSSGGSGSRFATAPAGGNSMVFPSSGGGGGGRGVIGGGSGSRSNGASPSMHAMSAPKSLVGNWPASRLGGGGGSGGGGEPFYDDHSALGSSLGTSHGSTLSRPGSAGPTIRSTNWSTSSSHPGGDGILSSSSVHGLSSGSSMGGRVRSGMVRKSSYDERRSAASWLDGPHNAPGGTSGSVTSATGRPSELSITHAPLFDQAGSKDASTWGATRGGSGSGSGTSGVASPSTEDMTAMMCAEFALLTPKRALEQQQQQQRQRQQQSPGRSSPLDMWSSTGWPAQGGGGDSAASGGVNSRVAAVGTRRGSDNSSNAGSGGGGGGGARNMESQESRGNSEVGSPAGPRPWRVGGTDSSGVGGVGDDVDENSASSGGSGGGGRQGSVRPAFGAPLDSAAGRGGGGGVEASIEGGTFDMSFRSRADGNGGNGGGIEAQQFDMPLMKANAFFGEDIDGVALEDTATGVPLSSSAPDDVTRLHRDDLTRSARGGAFSTGASPSRGGADGSVGTVRRSSPGALDESSLTAALENQLSF